MNEDLRPDPSGGERRGISVGVRSRASLIRGMFAFPRETNNGEIDKFAETFITNFSKGLPHDEHGIVDAEAFAEMVAFINQTRCDPADLCRDKPFGYTDPDGKDVILASASDYKIKAKDGKKPKRRLWESPLAGHVFDTQGPDSGDLTIPEAPTLDSDELAAEMAEVYALSLLRDVPFSTISKGGKITGIGAADLGLPKSASDVFKALKKLKFFKGSKINHDSRAEKRREARRDLDEKFTQDVLFRGSTDGAKRGPYISQFMLIGNAGREDATVVQGDKKASVAYNTSTMQSIEGGQVWKAGDGYILYGAQEINQRVNVHEIGKDYMSDWQSWLDVQNGSNLKDKDKYEDVGRFVTTPRDLATYVHFDALYQAYLNACLIMLGYGRGFDSGFPEGGDHPVRDAFATFGGPHILSLLTEVATRALKHARRQKFNIHLRARPEAVAALLTLSANGQGKKLGPAGATDTKIAFDNLKETGLLDMIDARNANVEVPGGGGNPAWMKKGNYLLPMAFPEGSPMHPSYAAGHATVAGACVTILKAFFEMFENASENVLEDWEESPFENLYGDTDAKRRQAFTDNDFQTGIFYPNPKTKAEIAARREDELLQVPQSERPITEKITILGELDKLAANISIGRDMAGVHYYTDYYESLRMGERVAVGILQEQMLTYPEEVRMRLKTFDGENMLIRGCGDGKNVEIDIGKDGASIRFDDWFTRID